MGDELRSTMNDDVLDGQLRDAVAYIDDDGFTARMVAKLPPVRHRTAWFRSVVLISVTLLASALAYFLSDGGRFIVVGLVRLSALPLLWLAILAFGGGLLAMAGGLYAALAKSGSIRA
jgi:hypothetical protein